jgi:hypothetical protein
MSAIAQCHRSAVKTRPSTPRAPPEPTQKKPDVGPHFRRPDCAKPSLAGEVDALESAAGGGNPSAGAGVCGDTPTPALPRKRERERTSVAARDGNSITPP